MKNIPGNKRATIRRCEAAYNIEAEGIWFDTDNSDIRILDNVVHDNGNGGIFFEINKGGGSDRRKPRLRQPRPGNLRFRLAKRLGGA